VSQGFALAAAYRPTRSRGWRVTQVRLSLMLWFFLAALPAIASDGPKEQPVKRVLVVGEDDSALPAEIEIAKGIRSGLDAHFQTGLELYTEYLDILRFPSPDHLRRLEADLAAKYANVHLDVVMTVGPSALQFMLENRAQIAADAPLIFGGVSEEGQIKDKTLPTDVKGVVSHFDVRKTIDLARRLQPKAKKAIVLTGSGDFDRRWEKSAREALDPYPNLDVEYLSGLTLEGFKEETKQLPTDAILLILTVFQDAGGRKFVPRDAAAEIAASSGAPAYAVYSSYIGRGVLGGYVETWESVGTDMARLTDKYLVGANPTPQIIRSKGTPVIDWPQMRRWGIDAARLPKDAVLQFYEPTAWERYRPEILAALAVVLLQAATIAALIVQDRRRRRIGQELAVERLELAHLSRRTQLGELSGAFAHELNQPLTSILANAEAGARLLRKDPPDTQELKEILRDIVEEDKRAAGVIAQLRRLMVKGEAKLDPIDLNEAVTATIALAGSELLARQTKCDFQRGQPYLPVRGNFVQMQQVILNLILNATDAMSQLAPSERHIAITTRRRDDGFRELAISDNGPGLAPEVRTKAFKPFVSTKPNGLGLGLAICHSIALAHGGTLKFDEQRTNGAQIILALPPT
jgi:signal transduction histidine kinase